MDRLTAVRGGPASVASESTRGDSGNRNANSLHTVQTQVDTGGPIRSPTWHRESCQWPGCPRPCGSSQRSAPRAPPLAATRRTQARCRPAPASRTSPPRRFRAARCTPPLARLCAPRGAAGQRGAGSYAASGEQGRGGCRGAGGAAAPPPQPYCARCGLAASGPAQNAPKAVSASMKPCPPSTSSCVTPVSVVMYSDSFGLACGFTKQLKWSTAANSTAPSGAVVLHAETAQRGCEAPPSGGCALQSRARTTEPGSPRSK